MFGFVRQVDRIQFFENLGQLFCKKLCIVKGVIVHQYNFMGCGIRLRKNSWQVILKIVCFIPGTNNYRYRMRLGLKKIRDYFESSDTAVPR